ncbi:MAG: hypothetical protein EZS28_034763, partial [Streblomastix strix]
AAKVIRSYSFDEQEWEAAGKLQTGEPIPFIVNFVAAKKFDEFVVILLEFTFKLADCNFRIDDKTELKDLFFKIHCALQSC